MTAYPITNTQEFTDKIKNHLRKYLGENWDTHYGRMAQVSDDLVYLIDDDYYLTEEVIATLHEEGDNQCPECERVLNPDSSRCHNCNPYEVTL